MNLLVVKEQAELCCHNLVVIIMELILPLLLL